MVKVNPENIQRLLSNGRRPANDFAEHNHRRVAVKIGEQVFCGVAFYLADPAMGKVLKIRIDGGHLQGTPEIILSEKDWVGRIIPDFHYGCRYLFIPETG